MLLEDAQASQVLQFRIVSHQLEVMSFKIVQALQFMPKPKANHLDGLPPGIMIVAQ